MTIEIGCCYLCFRLGAQRLSFLASVSKFTDYIGISAEFKLDFDFTSRSASIYALHRQVYSWSYHFHDINKTVSVCIGICFNHITVHFFGWTLVLLWTFLFWYKCQLLHTVFILTQGVYIIALSYKEQNIMAHLWVIYK